MNCSKWAKKKTLKFGYYIVDDKILTDIDKLLKNKIYVCWNQLFLLFYWYMLKSIVFIILLIYILKSIQIKNKNHF